MEIIDVSIVICHIPYELIPKPALAFPTFNVNYEAKALADFINSLFKFVGRIQFKAEPFVFHLMPEQFNTVQFRAMGWQKIKLHSLLFQ